MPLIPFPNVPKLPGVPQLNRSSAFPAGPPPALAGVLAAARLLLAIFTKPKWGIFTNDPPRGAVTVTIGGQTVTANSDAAGQARPVVVPDSIREFTFNNEWNVSDFPIEEGGFASYNKVNNPFEIQLRLTKSGTLKERIEMLAALDRAANSLNLYRIMTPEKTYLNCNITRVANVRREQTGAYFFTELDVFFREIRFVTAEYTSTAQNTQNAQDPAAVGPANQGDVAPAEAPPAVVTAAEGV